MTEFTFNLIRFGYLALLWLFVLAAVAVLRRDLAIKGKAVAKRKPAGTGAGAAAPATAANTGATSALAAAQPVVAVPGAPAAPAANAGPPPANGPVVVVGKNRAPTHLQVTNGPLAGSRLPLTGQPILIGRAASNTLVLEDDYASSRHAAIYPTESGWVVEDFGSTNGTFLNGAPLTGAAALPPGAQVTIGHSVLELVG